MKNSDAPADDGTVGDALNIVRSIEDSGMGEQEPCMAIKRYGFDRCAELGGRAMQEREGGPYVLHEDHLLAIAAEKVVAGVLRNVIKRAAHDFMRDYSEEFAKNTEREACARLVDAMALRPEIDGMNKHWNAALRCASGAIRERDTPNLPGHSTE